MIFSIHIPKTAGTSFRIALESSTLGMRSMYINRRKQLCLIGENCSFGNFTEMDYPLSVAEVMAIVRRSEEKIVHGHFFYETIAPFLEEGDRFIFWIRNPYERLLSEWCHHLSQAVRSEPPLQQLTFAELLERSRKTPAALETLLAMPHIAGAYRAFVGSLPLEHCLFIGEFETYKEDLQKLARMLGTQLKYRHDNAAPVVAILSPEFCDRVKSVIEKDIEFYEGLVEFKRSRF